MRIRTIKPDFWQHQLMSALPDFTRLLAIGLLNYCDDEGYFMAAPQSIRGAVFPFMDDSRRITVALRELSNQGYLRLGKLPDGRDVGHVVNFLEHQVINKLKLSKLKELAIFPEQSRIDTVAIPSGMEGKGTGKRNREGRGKCTLEEIIAFVLELELPTSDGEATFHKWEGNEWTNNGKKIADWKATIRSWKSAGYMPSQKNNGNGTPKPVQTVAAIGYGPTTQPELDIDSQQCPF